VLKFLRHLVVEDGEGNLGILLEYAREGKGRLFGSCLPLSLGKKAAERNFVRNRRPRENCRRSSLISARAVCERSISHKGVLKSNARRVLPTTRAHDFGRGIGKCGLQNGRTKWLNGEQFEPKAHPPLAEIDEWEKMP
jgi:hypothetical protein